MVAAGSANPLTALHNADWCTSITTVALRNGSNDGPALRKIWARIEVGVAVSSAAEHDAGKMQRPDVGIRSRDQSTASEEYMTLGSKIIAGCIGLSFLYTALAQAQELTGTLKKIKDSGAITLGHRDSSIPFSYYDDKQQVVGYAHELCLKIVDAIKSELGLPKIDVKLNPVTSATRIPLVANGTVDLECGSTTNNVDRQKQVAFTITHFLTANRFVSKKSSSIKTLADLKGKTVVSTSGTTNIKQINEINSAQNLGMTILPAKDHAEAFLMVETDRAVAFVMDDILLASLAAGSKAPDSYVISAEGLSKPEPYGIMMRRDDPAFKKVVDATMTEIYTSGDIDAIWDKWFTKPISPRGINLNTPMDATFKKLTKKPTDSPNPADY
jgi:glutamate/aspartate transport system substrate-binding protein